MSTEELDAWRAWLKSKLMGDPVVDSAGSASGDQSYYMARVPHVYVLHHGVEGLTPATVAGYRSGEEALEALAAQMKGARVIRSAPHLQTIEATAPSEWKNVVPGPSLCVLGKRVPLERAIKLLELLDSAWLESEDGPERFQAALDVFRPYPPGGAAQESADEAREPNGAPWERPAASSRGRDALSRSYQKALAQVRAALGRHGFEVQPGEAVHVRVERTLQELTAKLERHERGWERLRKVLTDHGVDARGNEVGRVDAALKRRENDVFTYKTQLDEALVLVAPLVSRLSLPLVPAIRDLCEQIEAVSKVVAEMPHALGDRSLTLAERVTLGIKGGSYDLRREIAEVRAYVKERMGEPYEGNLRDVVAVAVENLRRGRTPIPMVLTCPNCCTQHVDAPEPESGWENPPHRSHKCAKCGTVWRPADVPTVGVGATDTRGERDTWVPPGPWKARGPGNLVMVRVGDPAFAFESYEAWLQKGQVYYKDAELEFVNSIAIDRSGRVCTVGGDFKRAEKEGTTPVTVYRLDLKEQT